MTEKTVSGKIEDAYAKLKEVLLKKGCKIVAEETPMSISAMQGSLWGITPKTAKKQVIYRLFPHDSRTQITASSSLASDWKNLTIVGSALAVLVAAMCGWIAIDLETFTATQKPSSWSWIATVDGYANLQVAQMLANLGKVLAVFLAVVIVLEVVIALYAHFRVNAFAEETLSLLS
ncbi:MAG: hypothetical protein NWE99_03030 [Candidatus Bathyarchaeota archaeon]|nr:hypothetical protein [Candidatus Bathyarchaeota archaeon]